MKNHYIHDGSDSERLETVQTVGEPSNPGNNTLYMDVLNKGGWWQTDVLECFFMVKIFSSSILKPVIWYSE